MNSKKIPDIKRLGRDESGMAVQNSGKQHPPLLGIAWQGDALLPS
jgi:hypothetical protein